MAALLTEGGTGPVCGIQQAKPSFSVCPEPQTDAGLLQTARFLRCAPVLAAVSFAAVPFAVLRGPDDMCDRRPRASGLIPGIDRDPASTARRGELLGGVPRGAAEGGAPPPAEGGARWIREDTAARVTFHVCSLHEC